MSCPSSRVSVRLPALRDLVQSILLPTTEVDLRGASPCDVFDRLRVPGIAHMIDLDIYLHFLDERPSVIGNRCFVPRWHSAVPRILWAHGRQYYSRQLTAEEAARLQGVIDA